MTLSVANSGYGVVAEPGTLRIQRLLPGPIDRVWAYLTDSELRRRWFAAGEMTLEAGTPVELVWRNDELTDTPGKRPDSHPGESRMLTRITEIDPPRKLGIAWGDTGGVTFELQPQGSEVLLTLVHSGVPSRDRLLAFSPGWHVHLDILAALLKDVKPKPFWDEVGRLRVEYDQRLPA